MIIFQIWNGMGGCRVYLVLLAYDFSCPEFPPRLLLRTFLKANINSGLQPSGVLLSEEKQTQLWMAPLLPHYYYYRNAAAKHYDYLSLSGKKNEKKAQVLHLLCCWIW